MHRRKRAARRGAAAVEAAVILPFLLFLAAIAADWAQVLNYTIKMEQCARGGALVASDQQLWSQSPYNTSNVPYPANFSSLTTAQKAVITSAALGEAPNLTPAPTVAVSQVTGAAGNTSVVVTVSYAALPTHTSFSYPRLFKVQNSASLSRSVQMRVAPMYTK